MQKIALITGGTSGLGKAMAKALAQDNCIVFAAGRSIHAKSDNANIKHIYFDVTNDEIVKSAVASIIKEYGKIDILINCAGIGIAAAIEEIPLTEIHKAFNVNLYGTISTIKAVTPHMRNAKNGLIINISSIGGKVGLPFQGIYSSTKFALEGLSEALYMELKPFGIKVCLIEPGDYKTKVSVNRKIVQPEPNSPYKNRLKNFFTQLTSNIDKGLETENIHPLILKIVNSKNPKFRYKSGRFYENITPGIKALLPFKLFTRIMCYFYKL